MDENAERNGGDLVAEVIKSHNVKFIFTLCGGHVSPILVGAEALGIKVVDTRHEASLEPSSHPVSVIYIFNVNLADLA